MGEVAQLLQCLGELLLGATEQLLRLRAGRHARSQQAQPQRQRHQPLLRAVVQVTPEPAPRAVAAAAIRAAVDRWRAWRPWSKSPPIAPWHQGTPGIHTLILFMLAPEVAVPTDRLGA